MTPSNDSERLGQELASRLDELAPQPGRGLRDRVLRATAAVQQRRGPMAWLTARAGMLPFGQASAVLTVAVVALAIGIGVGASGWIGIVGRPTASPTAAAPSVRATTSPTPSPSIPLSTVYSSWTRLEVPDPTPHVFGGESVNDVVAFKGGYVAVGGINGGCCDGSYSADTRAVVWRSSDAIHWTLVPNQPAFALGRMTAAATDGTRIIVVGYLTVESRAAAGAAEQIGAEWTSTDGVTWRMFGRDPNSVFLAVFTDIAFTRAGFLATTIGGPGQEPLVYASPDGQTWGTVADSQTLGTGTIEAITATSTGAIAIGGTSGGRQNDGSQLPDQPVVWPSVDGQTWTRITGKPELGTGRMQSVAAIGGVIVAVGTDGSPGHPAFWRSTDGIQWQRSDLPGFLVDATERLSVVATDRGFAAFGLVSSGGTAVLSVWTSPDGSEWSWVAPPPLSPPVTGMRAGGALPMADGRLLIVGGVPGDPGHNIVPAAVILGS
jgi:hypothetical protein